ncbi:hypothetical protein ACFL1H_07695 [Nanoarchaeota archaeon]
MNERFLEDLKGNEERDITSTKSTTVDILNSICHKLLYEHDEDGIDIHSRQLPALYNMMLEFTKKEIDFDIDKSDLKYFIYANCNKDANDYVKGMYGIFTSILLDILDLDYFYINGYGNRFDSLFSLARNIDTLIIDNFEGDEIGSYIASYESKANLVALINNKGNRIGINIASENGEVKNLIYFNNNGYHIGTAAVNEGKVNNFIFLNNTGKFMVSGICQTMAEADLVLIANCKDSKFMNFYGHEEGKVNNTVFINNDCKMAFGIGNKGTEFDTVVMKDNIQSIPFGRMNIVKKVICVGEDRPYYIEDIAKKIITGKQAETEYNKLSKKYSIETILKLPDSELQGEDFAKYLIKTVEGIK